MSFPMGVRGRRPTAAPHSPTTTPEPPSCHAAAALHLTVAAPDRHNTSVEVAGLIGELVETLAASSAPSHIVTGIREPAVSHERTIHVSAAKRRRFSGKSSGSGSVPALGSTVE